MNLGIFIPTKGRVDNQRFYDDYLKWVGPDLLEHIYLVCPTKEVALHEAKGRRAIGYDHENLSQSMNHIVHELGPAMGYTHVGMIDDDSKFAVRISPDAYNLRQAEPGDFGPLLEKVKSLLAIDPLVGICIRQNSNNAFPEDVIYCGRQNQAHFVDIAFFKEHDIQIDRVVLKGDFYMTLSVLSTGHRNAIIADYTIDQWGSSNAPGGVSAYRTFERMNQSAYAIQEMFPRHVEIVRKKNVWPGFPEAHMDCKVFWKRAYYDGLVTTGQHEKAKEFMYRPRAQKDIDWDAGVSDDIQEARAALKNDTRKAL